MSRYDKDGLTKREKETLLYIQYFINKHGYSPTMQELADALITSRSFIRTVLYNLRDKGFIDFQYKKIRTITVTKKVQ